MPPPYHMVRANAAAATAINTAVAATLDSVGATVGAITVPTDLQQKAIVAIYGSFNVSGVTATGIGTNFCVRLTGNGVVAQQDLALAGFMSIVTTPGQVAALVQYNLPLAMMGGAIPTSSQGGGQITVQFFAAGGAIAVNWSGACTLVFA